MNANELADHMEKYFDSEPYCDEAATMLRQQQAEIEALKMGFANNGTSDSELAEVRALANRQFLKIQALKQIIDANNLSQNIGQFVQPANEPVAYRYEDKSNPLVFYFTTRKDEINNPDAIEIPLYTHPAKEPTVDEVMAEHCTCYKLGYSQLNDYASVKAK